MTRLVAIAGMVLLLGSAGTRAWAQQDADSYFHEAARQYVAGNDAAAQRAVERGLEQVPTDPRLNALLEKLQQSGRPKRQQDSSSANSDNQSQQNTNSSSSNAAEQGESENASRSDDGESQQSGRDTPSTGDSGQPDPQSESTASADSSAMQEARRREGGTPTDTLSRAQAERLLRALEGQERQLLRQLRTRSADRRSVEKDW